MLQKLFHDFMTLFIAIAGHEPIRRQRRIATQGLVVAAAILLGFIAVAQLRQIRLA